MLIGFTKGQLGYVNTSEWGPVSTFTQQDKCTYVCACLCVCVRHLFIWVNFVMVIKVSSFHCITYVVILLVAGVDEDICCHCEFPLGGHNLMKSLFNREGTNTLSRRWEEERRPAQQ